MHDRLGYGMANRRIRVPFTAFSFVWLAVWLNHPPSTV